MSMGLLLKFSFHLGLIEQYKPDRGRRYHDGHHRTWQKLFNPYHDPITHKQQQQAAYAAGLIFFQINIFSPLLYTSPSIKPLQ